MSENSVCTDYFIHFKHKKNEQDRIAEKADVTAVEAKKTLDATIEAIKDAVVAGDKVQLLGFGTFAVKKRPARQGVNPSTGAKITIAAKKVVKFAPGAEFEAKVNK